MYDIPSPEEFKKFLKKHNLTAAKTALYSGVNLRTVQRWTAPPGQKGARSIPWAAWALIRILAGDLDLETLLKDIETAEAERKKSESLKS
ncbi:MAG: hypothetical protein LBJ31_04390 [Treponema sp.]|nr:hypothetical protein [Treponema sp.]